VPSSTRAHIGPCVRSYLLQTSRRSRIRRTRPFIYYPGIGNPQVAANPVMCCTRLSSKRTQRLVVLDEAGQRLVARRLPEGLTGIETDCGLWASALAAAGHRVWTINPMAAARYRDRDHAFGRKVRCRGRQATGRSRAHRLAQPPRDRRRHPWRRGDQAAGPHP